jgi:hypothetical protein
MKIIKYFIILIIISVSCSAPPEKVQVFKSENIAKLENFFKRSETDSIKARNVIEKHKIIQHLTHLKKMDNGGKKYYLLEKDNITEMIRSVTQGIYLDYILINKSGDIVYTRTNGELFGTNINNIYDSPLKKCFINRGNVFFEDVSFSYPSTKVCSLHISSPIFVDGNFHGIFILQVEINKINEVLDNGTEIFSKDGIIRVTPFNDRVLLKYTGYENINMGDLESSGYIFINRPEGKIRFSIFNYKEITWIVAGKEG